LVILCHRLDEMTVVCDSDERRGHALGDRHEVVSVATLHSGVVELIYD